MSLIKSYRILLISIKIDNHQKEVKKVSKSKFNKAEKTVFIQAEKQATYHLINSLFISIISNLLIVIIKNLARSLVRKLVILRILINLNKRVVYLKVISNAQTLKNKT